MPEGFRCLCDAVRKRAVRYLSLGGDAVRDTVHHLQAERLRRDCIKVDYWDIHALADAMYSICHNESLFDYLAAEGKREVDQITWEKVGAWIRELYLRTLGWQ